MENLSTYDFSEITLEELKNQYPFPDFPWEVAVEEDIFIQMERANSTDLIAQSLKTLKDPMIIFAPCDDEGKPNPAVEDLRSKIQAKYDRQIQIRTEYIRFLDDRLQEFNQPEAEPLDLSNTSAVEKIIYLNELGIIDFLKTKQEFTGSTNLMATFLSAITGEKQGTLQTSLNRLIKKDTEDKNHPYKAQNTVNKVRQTLIDKNIKPKTS